MMVSTSGILFLEFNDLGTYDDFNNWVRPDETDVIGTVRRLADFVEGANAGMRSGPTISGTWVYPASGTSLDVAGESAGAGAEFYHLGIC